METQHKREVDENLRAWQKKPLLQAIYRGFHEEIRERLGDSPGLLTVELGSGVGSITRTIPGCIRTDLTETPWVDQVESAYALSFADESVGNLILFDVFHHLRHPGSALSECSRVLPLGGRIIIFEPAMSLLGRLVFGLLHPEPLGMSDEINWTSPKGWSGSDDYYAAQGNASRVFASTSHAQYLQNWSILEVRYLSAISYIASGGYSKPQLYPNSALPAMRWIDRVCDRFPRLFATRMLIVLEKVQESLPR